MLSYINIFKCIIGGIWFFCVERNLCVMWGPLKDYMFVLWSVECRTVQRYVRCHSSFSQRSASICSAKTWRCILQKIKNTIQIKMKTSWWFCRILMLRSSVSHCYHKYRYGPIPRCEANIFFNDILFASDFL